jgi:hypothetical protein
MITYTIQSANRSFTVPVMSKVLSDVEHFWFVPKGSENSYKEAGAKNVIPVEGTLPMKSKQLNAALDFSFNRNTYCVTMDDDWISSKVLDIVNGKKKSKDMHLSQIIDEMYSQLSVSPYYIAGVTSNTNPFYANDSISKKGMISGQFILHKSQDNVRFDNDVSCIEDFDYVVAHHIKYGGLLKFNKFLVNFHMINRGNYKNNGVGGYDLNIRKEENLLNNIKYIEEKWNNPNLIIQYNGFGKSLHKKVKWSKLNE